MERRRFCIFCGKPPDEKTKEHILPQWLIELTGPPKRVVNFGVNPLSGKQPRFDWSSFTFPACAVCNQRYSDLESSAKNIVERLLEGTPVTGYDYIQLLDWLDKVRVGLWLGYYYLHKNPVGIQPSFHIISRIGQKDRMVAIYTIDTNKQGLSAYGAETLLFQLQPSCFSLNINCIHILNMSWDYMCSSRCGFPFPHQRIVNLDLNGLPEYFDYAITHKIKHPILRRPIIKPAMHIYQPILHAPISMGDYAKDTWVKNMLIPGSEQQGLLIRQYESHIDIIKDCSLLLEYNDVTGYHCRPLKDIVSQTYDLQLKLLPDTEYKSSNPTKLKEKNEMVGLFRKLNIRYRDAVKNIKK